MLAAVLGFRTGAFRGDLQVSYSEFRYSSLRSRYSCVRANLLLLGCLTVDCGHRGIEPGTFRCKSHTPWPRHTAVVGVLLPSGCSVADLNEPITTSLMNKQYSHLNPPNPQSSAKLFPFCRTVRLCRLCVCLSVCLCSYLCLFVLASREPPSPVATATLLPTVTHLIISCCCCSGPAVRALESISSPESSGGAPVSRLPPPATGPAAQRPSAGPRQR